MNQSDENFEYPTSESAQASEANRSSESSRRGNGTEKTVGINAQMRDTVAQAKQKIGETMSAAQERSRQVVDTTSGYIQRWPFGAIAVAAGVGMIVGWVLAQQSRSQSPLHRSWW